MNILKFIFSAMFIFMFGFIVGIYSLPILVAPPSLSMLELATASENTTYQTDIPDNLSGSDLFHYGEGSFYISGSKIVFDGKLSPGPDYQLYLSKHFVQDEAEFLEHKDSMINISEVKRFDGFIANIPEDIDVKSFNSVIIWCEAFSEFITAAKFKN